MDAKRRVAVIDDAESIRKMLEVALGLEGFEVRGASDGVAGLSPFERGNRIASSSTSCCPKWTG